jgi:hypothetical protein
LLKDKTKAAIREESTKQKGIRRTNWKSKAQTKAGI